MKSTSAFVVLFVSLSCAHMSVWNPASFDRDTKNVNSNDLANPLENMKFNQWWWHGNLDYPPDKTRYGDKAVMNIPANGLFDLDIASNRAFTSIDTGKYFPYVADPSKMDPREAPDPWELSYFGNVSNAHAPHRLDVAGCAVGIAYKSDHREVKPNDFVIFTVEHDCPARFLQNFSVPNLPACPNDQCMCAWFWVHKSIGGTDQIYMAPFVCKVTNAKADASPVDYAHIRAPRKCLDPADCVMGPRTPMYWKLNSDDDNMPEGGHNAPTYSILYGFRQGAQFDIFVNTNPVTRTNKPVPAETPNTNATLNPLGVGHRLVSGGSKDSLFSVSSLGSNRIVSPSGQYYLSVNGDGNMILWNQTDGSIVWTSGGNGVQGKFFQFTVGNDGAVTVKNDAGVLMWTSPMTKGVGIAPYRLEITDLGILVLYDGRGLDLWESGYLNKGYPEYNRDLSPFTPDPKIWPTKAQLEAQGVALDSNTASGSALVASLCLVVVGLLL